MAKAKQTAEKDPLANIEKMNDGTMSGLKKTIIGTVGTLITAGGAFLLTYVQKPKESDNKQVQPQSININIPQQQQAAASGGKTVIIKEKAAEAKSTAPVKKKEGDEFKKEDPKW
jgi:hypothetical protein